MDAVGVRRLRISHKKDVTVGGVVVAFVAFEFVDGDGGDDDYEDRPQWSKEGSVGIGKTDRRGRGKRGDPKKKKLER